MPCRASPMTMTMITRPVRSLQAEAGPRARVPKMTVTKITELEATAMLVIAFDVKLWPMSYEMWITSLNRVSRAARLSVRPNSGTRSVPSCKTCTQVSYQRISILTLNFNMSFVGHLANVATLEYFTLTVLFSVFVERCSRVWFGCIERYTWF